MKVNYAEYVGHYAYLSEDFGQELAKRKLNLTEEQLEEIVGRYTRGKRKGFLRGCLTWVKCVKGGWVKTGPYDRDAMRANGYVEKKGITKDYQIVDAWTREPIFPKTRQY